MTTTTPTRDLIQGFAQLVADAGIGFTWHASAGYTASEFGIYRVRIPTDADNALVISPYPLTADPTRPENETGIQFYLRTADPSVGVHWDLRDALDNVLLGNFPLDLPTGLRVTVLTFTSGTLPALDDNQRWVSIANHTARHQRPSAHRN